MWLYFCGLSFLFLVRCPKQNWLSWLAPANIHLASVSGGGPPVQPQPGASTHCGLARLRQLAKSNPVDIQGCIEITRDDLCHPTNVEKHMIKELQQFQQLDKYKRVFAWKIGNGCRFKEPIPYKHNKGAVSWVRLKEVKKTRINTR